MVSTTPVLPGALFYLRDRRTRRATAINTPPDRYQSQETGRQALKLRKVKGSASKPVTLGNVAAAARSEPLRVIHITPNFTPCQEPWEQSCTSR